MTAADPMAFETLEAAKDAARGSLARENARGAWDNWTDADRRAEVGVAQSLARIDRIRRGE